MSNGQMNLRVKDERLALIDRAAEIRGVTRTEFVLRASEAAAIETLNERPVITLDDEAYGAFLRSPRYARRTRRSLKRTLRAQPLWER